MEALIRMLHSVHPMSEGLVEWLSLQVKTKELGRKELLLKAGHVCRHIYFIQSGLLRCFYDKGNTEVCTWFMKEGDLIVSIESFYKQTTSYESIQALEDCLLYYIEHKELYYLFNTYPEFNFIARELTQHYYILWAQQLFGLRMQTPAQRYQWLLKNHSELILRVPSKYLASYLGIGEVTLSRLKGKQKLSRINAYNTI